LFGGAKINIKKIPLTPFSKVGKREKNLGFTFSKGGKREKNLDFTFSKGGKREENLG